jgi:ribosomal protein L34E
MSRLAETTELRWFEQFPKCGECGRTSQGILRGSQNQSYGHHCQKCADKRLKASAKARGEA